jgi:hypothetical protein
MTEIISGFEEEIEESKRDAVEKALKFKEKLSEDLQEEFITVMTSFYSYGFDVGAHTGVMQMKKDLLGGDDGDELLSSEED